MSMFSLIRRRVREAAPYGTLFKIRFINGLQYRIAAWAGLTTQFAWGFMNILLFYAFYSENPANFPMTFEQFASYTWLNQALLMLFATWFWDQSIFDDIISGNISYELARPVDLYNMWLIRGMATRISRVVLRCLPILAVAFLLPKPFGLTPPADIFTFALFIVSVFFAFVLINLFGMYLYIMGFHTINASGVRLAAIGMADLLSGHLIPLPFFPEPVLRIVNFLPFASMQNVPLFIYSGYTTKEEALSRIGVQIFWIVLFYITGKLLMKNALKKVIVQGG
jgi:ABC-2 type transport system permease protein